jgi:hypothetical protein
MGGLEGGLRTTPKGGWRHLWAMDQGWLCATPVLFGGSSSPPNGLGVAAHHP